MMTEEQQIQCFGATKAALEAGFERSFGHPMMKIMGMMSDAQELMERGHYEAARKMLNVAKYFISKHGFKDIE